MNVWDHIQIDGEPDAIALDCETELIRPGCLTPRLVCVSTALSETEYELYHHTEAREFVVAALESHFTLVGHNIAFDLAVFANEWPDLLPLIFEVYEADRISDTGIREKLIHLARGVLRKFEWRTSADLPEGGGWVKFNYGLADLVERHLGIVLQKGGWQLRFGELRDLPLAFWPEEAKQYAIGDAVTTLAVWKKQAQDQKFLEDEHRQARAEWWLHLMSCWGLHTDLAGVREFARRTQQKYDVLAAELVAAGLVRANGTRNVKAVQDRVVLAVQRQKAAEVMKLLLDECSEDRAIRIVDAAERDDSPLFFSEMAALGLSNEALQGEFKELRAKVLEAATSKDVERTPTGKPKTDADCCERSGDPVLEKYAELSSLKKTLSTDIPLLESGTHTPIQARFEVLLENGRTSTTPNIQNLPTEIGVRECFVPREGRVFALADFSGFELRTWAQICIYLKIPSKLAEALNSGNDPHLELARRILGISYEQAEKEYEDDPKGRVYHPRQASKSGNFGFPGGLGIVRFREYARKNYGVVLSEAKAAELRAFWYETWPEARPYFNWVNTQCMRKPTVIKQAYSNRYRGGVSFTDGANGMFSALAADAAKAAGFLVAKACYVDRDSPLYGCRPVDYIHDEEIVEVPDDEFASDSAEELARLMKLGASPFLPDVPPVCKPMLARRWSKAAKALRGLDGRLIPWDFENERCQQHQKFPEGVKTYAFTCAACGTWHCRGVRGERT